MRVLIFAGVILLAACERREVPPDQRAADSTVAAVLDSVRIDSARVDSLRADSLRTDSVRADSIRAAAARAKSSPRIIGHDSAFGPLFAVDSLGRKVELPVRRP
jgi:hypothetical protein